MKIVTQKKIVESKYQLLTMHYNAGVGHIGGNLSSLDFLIVLFNEFLSKNHKFILSKGHSAGALYIAMWSAKLLSDSYLKTFHGNNTFLPGHPPINKFPSIVFSTGSLGHGLSLSSGIALANKIKQNKNITYCLTSDGEWQEGSTWEALIFACHHKLKNLNIIIDKNNLQGFGKTASVSSMEDLKVKLSPFDLVLFEIDGHNINEIRHTLSKKTNKVKVIILNTIKGNGVSFMENRLEWHYKSLSHKQYLQAIKELGYER